MTLRYALLGLLAESASSGYNLTQRFTEGIGSFAWSARHSQIYPELIKLDDEGLVEIVDEGPRGRKVYAITDPGRKALQDWLLGPPGGSGSVRNEFVLRLFLLSALEPDDARSILSGVVAYADEQLAVLAEQQQLMADEGMPTAYGPNLAAMYGVYSYRATRDWARWAIGELGSAG